MKKGTAPITKNSFSFMQNQVAGGGYPLQKTLMLQMSMAINMKRPTLKGRKVLLKTAGHAS